MNHAKTGRTNFAMSLSVRLIGADAREGASILAASSLVISAQTNNDVSIHAACIGMGLPKDAASRPDQSSAGRIRSIC